MRFDGVVPLYAKVIAPVFNVLFRLKGRSGGAFFFCTRKALAAAGGWDESLFAGEELYLAMALKKVGRFVVIREPVLTSGRKLRSHTGRELLGVLFSVARNPKRLKGKEGLDVWYGPRSRDDSDDHQLK